jgi:hypothetical protein
MHLPRCVEASCVVAHSRYKYCLHSTRLTYLPRFSLISAALHLARRACPLMYTTARYLGVVAMQVYLIDSTGQLSLKTSLKVKSSASAAHARSRSSAVVLAHACRHAHTHDLLAPHICCREPCVYCNQETAGCGETLESVQRAPAKAKLGIATTPLQLHLPIEIRCCLINCYHDGILEGRRQLGGLVFGTRRAYVT